MNWFGYPTDDRPRQAGQSTSTRRPDSRRPVVEDLERRQLLSATPRAARKAANAAEISAQAGNTPVLTTSDVELLLDRATAASSDNNAIIAIVDRGGNILGVRIEDGVAANIRDPNSPDKATRVFAIDGALAKARTAAFFANDTAPLTSRTIQNISQTTMIQREIDSNPNITDPNSTLRGPGFVAPVGFKGHFPPGVQFTPQVDLFAIEHTNRDSILHQTDPNLPRSDTNETLLPGRFNIDPQYVPPGQGINAPESYGLVSGELVSAQSRGIATLPGGIPIYKKGAGGKPVLVGGIGVFFPGTTGFATEENSKLNDAGLYNPKKPDLSEEAEFIAFAATGGAPNLSPQLNLLGKIGNAPALPKTFNGLNATPTSGRIDLVGISLDIVGGHGLNGPNNLLRSALKEVPGPLKGTINGANQTLKVLGADGLPTATNQPDGLVQGKPVPAGILVTPHASADGTLTAADVQKIIQNSIDSASRTRSAIRLPLNNTARMMIAVTDKDGNVLGLYRMPDATFFSIDVAVSKARNVNYYANAAKLQNIDKTPGVPAGTAFTNRTFRYLSLPRFPEGIDGYPPGPFSILNDDNSALSNDGRQVGPPLPASAFQSVQGHDAFNPGTNFHDQTNVLNQSGIVFFPGSTPLYKDLNGDGKKELVGGFGISGDGVDQDDVVTYNGHQGFAPEPAKRADNFKVRGVRLPYQKFNRQPRQENAGVTQNEPKISNPVSANLATAVVNKPALARAARAAKAAKSK